MSFPWHVVIFIIVVVGVAAFLVIALNAGAERAQREGRACRVCGCTDNEACWPNGCFWVERYPSPLCSACVPADQAARSSLEGPR